MNSAIYLDHNATTTIRPEIIDLVAQIMAETGNASSVHASGRQARAEIEKARRQVAALAGTQPEYVIFNSGATESNNCVLNAFRGETIMISAIEHSSVRNGAAALYPEERIIKIPVTSNGVIDLEAFEALVTAHRPALLSLMLVNSETGVIQPVAEAARIARRIHPDIFIHSDAVQAAGRIEINMGALGVDYLSLSAHKMGGPQGCGALLSAPGAKPAVLLHGGGQEKRQRSGTENVAGIAGMGLAAEMAAKNITSYQNLASLRDSLELELCKINNGVHIYGRNAPRVANTCCFSCPGLAAQTQLMALDLDGIAVSSGSACSSGSVKHSAVLLAMTDKDELLESALRFSLGWNSTQKDVDAFLKSWGKLAKRMADQKADQSGDNGKAA